MNNKAYIINKSIELINTFNPTINSIDTHCTIALGNISPTDGKPENIFIQQVVYGWYREKAVLEAFITNLYADNASSVLRADMTMYTVFAYLAIFRLDELGFQTFKEFTMTVDPTKMYNFTNYLFNKDVLWSSLRDSWMKVRDLSYVEDEIIAGIEQFLPELSKFCSDLQEKALGVAAAQAAKEEIKKSGTAGLQEVVKRKGTRPVSPNIHKPRPTILPVPDRIPTNIVAKEVPNYLDNNNLASIEERRKIERNEERARTKSQYDDALLFKLNVTKNGRKLEDIRREMEEERTKDLHFDNSYVNEPPDFTKINAKVRINASTILREDSLFRKQQEKDVQLLKNYEYELRDPTEFYSWQNEMKSNDHQNKLNQVVSRREQAKQSSEDAKIAFMNMKDDNRTIAAMLREQGEAIKEQKQLESEIQIIANREIAKKIIADESTKPKIATAKVLEIKKESGVKMRIEIEQARKEKEEEDKILEDIKADKIRQLRAINTVHKKHIKVFDPTQTAGIGLLDEMSYMEMKERNKTESARRDNLEIIKRQEILEAKAKKAKSLNDRAISVLNARKIKAESTKEYILKKKEAELKEVDIKERAREIAAIQLQKELAIQREEKKKAAALLVAEEERIRRQQQYMGAAAGLVEETRHGEILMAREREMVNQQNLAKEESKLEQESKYSDLINKNVFKKQEQAMKLAIAQEKEKNVIMEKRILVEKIKADVVYKKSIVREIRAEHGLQKTKAIEYNPYAEKINQESISMGKTHQDKLKSLTNSLRSKNGITFGENTYLE